MKEKVDHSKLRAKPEDENFNGKYTEGGFIAKKLVDNYFISVSKLLSKCQTIEKAHEIGAGEGLSTLRLKSMVPLITASEFVEELVKKAQFNNPQIAVFQESVYDLKYGDDSVDLVFLLEVLEHLDYPEKALQEIKRVTSRYLILGVPREPLWRFLNMCRFKYLRDLGNTPGHLNHWSTQSIVKLIEQEFGSVIAIETPIPWTIILAEKKLS
jgi:ubiquinone/menaquinone biosynthesis C-methylase UbiE